MRLKKTLFLIFFCIILDNSLSYSQIAGESTYQFLNIPSSPRHLALGGKNVTIQDDDVISGLFNPSSISQEMDNMFSVNYFTYFSDISYGSLAYAYRLDNRGNTIHFGFSYINYGDFVGYDEFGNYTTDFSGNESVFSVGYALSLIHI